MGDSLFLDTDIVSFLEIRVLVVVYRLSSLFALHPRFPPLLRIDVVFLRLRHAGRHETTGTEGGAKAGLCGGRGATQPDVRLHGWRASTLRGRALGGDSPHTALHRIRTIETWLGADPGIVETIYSRLVTSLVLYPSVRYLSIHTAVHGDDLTPCC